MKSPWILASVAAAALAAAVLFDAGHAWSSPASVTYEADPEHSYVLFRIRHSGVSWQYGRFNQHTATVETGEGGSGITSVAFTVKAESVDTGVAKRDAHLRLPDFFNSKQFPDITFKSTAVKAVDADTSEVTGDLSLHGVTKSVTARVVKVGSATVKGTEIAGYEAVLNVKRSDFGMTKPVGEGSDDVTVTVAVEAGRK